MNNLGWVALWIAIAAVVIAAILVPKGEDPNRPIIEKCVQNGGVPVYDKIMTNQITDCKIYTK
jgi:hypothetical protein